MNKKTINLLFALYTAGLFLTSAFYFTADFGKGVPKLYAVVTAGLCLLYLAGRFSVWTEPGVAAFSVIPQLPAIFLYLVYSDLTVTWLGRPFFVTAAQGASAHLILALAGICFVFAGRRERRGFSREGD